MSSETRPRPAFAPHLDLDRGRGLSISSSQDIDGGGLISAASLLFAPGDRPGADDVARLAEANPEFIVSFDPAAEGQLRDAGDWVELLVQGLTFDLVGLAPGPAATRPSRRHDFSLTDAGGADEWEAVTLRPGPHLAAGATLQPVVRALAGLAARLAGLPDIRAVAWHPAGSWCEPVYFRESVTRWLDGGVFPGLGLAAFEARPDGSIESRGLALFTGQEVRLDPTIAEDRAEATKTGLRLLHWLVDHGRLNGPDSVLGHDGRQLRLEPAASGRIVNVWRE